VKTFIGGRAMNKDIAAKDKGRIVVGTPGRLVHLITKYHMDLSKVKLVVLDEADKLMEPSFFAELVQIFTAMPQEKQVISASATYPDDLDKFIIRFMRAPCIIQLNHEMPVLVAVNQFAVDVRKFLNYKKGFLKNEDSDALKFTCLTEILQRFSFTQGIIFCSRQLG